jgi:hypothetical protein
MTKRLSRFSSTAVAIALALTLANVPSASGTENNSAHWLAQTETSGNAFGEARSTGKLAIGPSGVYIFFYSGENTGIPQTAKTFISGVAPDLTEAELKDNIIWVSTMEAWDAWLRCLEAKEKSKNKEIPEAQAQLACAEARKKNAVMEQVTAREMLTNPLSDQQEWEQILSESEQEILTANEIIQAWIDAGAEPYTAETFTEETITDLEPQIAVPVQTTTDKPEEEANTNGGSTLQGG